LNGLGRRDAAGPLLNLLHEHVPAPQSNRETAHWCAALGVARATFYRHAAEAVPKPAQMELRDALQRLALAWPSYGYRRLRAALKRQGFKVKHQRVLAWMREDNLLCLRDLSGFVVTTDSRHAFPLSPNLAREMTLTALNQLWIAASTDIRLRSEFVYLAVILDAGSRRVSGWAVSRHIDSELTLIALRMALSRRQFTAGLVHHSDRGVQYAATDYVTALEAHNITVSISRKGNPYDNAHCERFMRTLKYEEVYLSDYETLSEAEASIEHFLEEVYNQKRLHSALGYVPPAEFEQSLTATYP